MNTIVLNIQTDSFLSLTKDETPKHSLYFTKATLPKHNIHENISLNGYI